MTHILTYSRSFCFMHIPKTGGSSLRDQLRGVDETGGRFAFKIGTHPALGRIQFGHLPLAVLADHYPDDFSFIGRARSFAFTRDPRARFRSAFAQRCRQFLDLDPASLGRDETLREVDNVVAQMRDTPGFPPPEFCHFMRQTDFVELGGVSHVSDLWPVEQVDEAISEMATVLGKKLGSRVENQTRTAKPGVVASMARGMWGSVNGRLPAPARKSLARRFRRLGYTASKAGPNTAFDDSSVTGFVADFYASDAKLHQRTTRMRTQPNAALGAERL